MYIGSFAHMMVSYSIQTLFYSMRMNIHSDYRHRFLEKDWKWSAHSSLEDNPPNVGMAVFHLTSLFGYTGFF